MDAGEVVETDNIWEIIWKFKGPMLASLNLWMMLHGGLPTAQFLRKRKMLTSPLCTWCQQNEQSAIHLLRDCFLARRTWQLILQPTEWEFFFAPQEVKVLIKCNIQRNSINSFVGK